MNINQMTKKKAKKHCFLTEFDSVEPIDRS